MEENPHLPLAPPFPPPFPQQRYIHAPLPSGMSSSQTQLTAWKWRRVQSPQEFFFQYSIHSLQTVLSVKILWVFEKAGEIVPIPR